MRAALDRYLANALRNEWDAGCLVTRVLNEAVDFDVLNEAFGSLKQAVRTVADPQSLCEFVAGEGFVGDSSTYYALDNSRLDHLLTQRRGIPITLGVLYVELGRAAGLSMRGIGFPGHFLVGADDALIDPFTNCVIATDAWRAWLREHDLLAHAGVELTRAAPDDIALRMLNNAKRVLFGRSDNSAVATALDVVDCQLALGGDAVALHLERAELWRRLGSIAGVRAALTDARDATTDPSVRAAMDARIASIPRLPTPTSH
ncbi:MAG: hypothetical protein HC809_14870 [Gammaproteobacteria bacterium]|nr:hypothetical protein [Gammaproteobacteria bacterium]